MWGSKFFFGFLIEFVMHYLGFLVHWLETKWGLSADVLGFYTEFSGKLETVCIF